MAVAYEDETPARVAVYAPIRLRPKPLLQAAGAGLVARILLPVLGVATGMDGVDYYGEVHNAALNRWVHTLLMPVAAYGALLWMGDLLAPPFTPRRGYVQVGAYFFYLAHYVTISVKVAAAVALVYAVPLALAVSSPHGFLRGLTFFVAALLMQEIGGHWLSGDPPSRPDAAFNAALYAPYFSVAHVLDGLE